MSYKTTTISCISAAITFSLANFAMEVTSASTDDTTIIDVYRKNYPRIGEQRGEVVNQIVNYLRQLGENTGLSAESLERYQRKIDALVTAGKPLKFLILGFPCKSKNTDTKVITDNFDLGDYLGLVTLQSIADQISSIYSPGCSITIVNKEPYIEAMGLIAEQKIGINPYPLECLDDYEQKLKKALLEFPNLSLGKDFSEEYAVAYAVSTEEKSPSIDMISFYANDLNTEEINVKIRSILDDEFKIRQKEREQEIKELRKNGESTRSVKPLQKVSKKSIDSRRAQFAEDLAKERQKGTAVLREIVAGYYEDYVRLSIRGDATKIGLNLVYGCSRTPWHMSLLFDNGSIKLIDRASLEREKSSKPYYGKAIERNGLVLWYVNR